MALPTAPLGSLPNLNLPTSNPRYQKPDSILDKALAAFLVNVATQAGGQMGENMFAKDYGSEPTSWLKKPFTGPQVGEREHLMGKQEAAQTARFNASEAGADRRQKAQLDATAMEGALTREQQLKIEGQRLKHELDRLGISFGQESELLDRRLGHDIDMANLGLANAKDLKTFERTGLPLSPTDASQVSLDAARVEQIQMENARLAKMLEMISNGQQMGAQGQPQGMNLSAAELAVLRDTPTQPDVVNSQGQPAPVAPPVTPELMQLMQMLQQSFGQPGTPQMDPALLRPLPTLQRNF
jgi:hypothetical protein